MSEEMDPAMAVEVMALRHQNAMNSVIDRGDSPIQQFYSNSTVLVTGGLGFLGKQFIEKLFRSCKIKKMFLIIRPKKEQTIEDRLEIALKDPVFDGLHKKQPGFVKKLVTIEGDIADIGLGLSHDDRKTISEQVDMIFHMAATVSFDESIRTSVLINVRGTREMISLARECGKLRNMVYISTAYAHSNERNAGKDLFEKFYPCPMPPDLIIQLVETLDEGKLGDMTPILIGDWPNTYAFTKAIAEEVVRTAAHDLPICVVKPPIVVGSYCEPMPGWLDLSCVFGASGVIVGAALGAIHVIYIEDIERKLAIVPVDIVNNAIIAAGWDSAEKTLNKDAIIYTIANTEVSITWKFAKNILESEYMNFASPKTVWCCYLMETGNRLIYRVLSWLLHYIPAYLLDGVSVVMMRRPKGIKSYVKLFAKIEKVAMLCHYFCTHEFLFHDDNVRAMIRKMSPADRHIYNCDLQTIDLHEFVKIWTIGIKKYIIKDGLKNSAEGRKRQRVFRMFNYLFGLIYLYVMCSILYLVWRVIEYLF